MKIKRVKSKSGKIYEYDASKYKYKHKSSRGLVLVSAKGKVNQKNVDKFKDIIDSNDSYTLKDKISLKARLDEYVYQRKSEKNGKRLTSSGFLGHIEATKKDSNRVKRLMANAGYSPEEVAREYDIDIDELLNLDNWSGDTFTYQGRTYLFSFTYTGSIFSEA